MKFGQKGFCSTCITICVVLTPLAAICNGITDIITVWLILGGLGIASWWQNQKYIAMSQYYKDLNKK